MRLCDSFAVDYAALAAIRFPQRQIGNPGHKAGALFHLPTIDQDRLEKAHRASEVLRKLVDECETDPVFASEFHDSLSEIARRVLG